MVILRKNNKAILPDRKAFAESVVMLMRGEGEEQFTGQEIYRLNKFVSKVKA